MNPFLLLLLVLVGVPLVELYFLIEIGSEIGAIPTIFLTVFTAVLGGLMVRVQGFSTLMRVREVTARGEVPALEVFEGAVLLVCGLLLLFPGFFTDILGFLLLIPGLRRWLILGVLKRSQIISPSDKQQPGDAGSGPRVIEGEYHREDKSR